MAQPWLRVSLRQIRLRNIEHLRGLFIILEGVAQQRTFVIVNNMFARVNPAEAKALLKKGITVIDVREHAEFVGGHLPGARHMSLADVRACTREALPAGAILFVCAGGVRSEAAARVADALGVDKTYSLVGGTTSWIKAGFSVVREAPSSRRIAAA